MARPAALADLYLHRAHTLRSPAADASHPGSRPFGRDTLASAPRQLLREGRWANAVVFVIEHRGERWTVKDFRPRGFIVRNTIGRILVGRETAGLRRLQGVAGVPQRAFRIDAHALAYLFVPAKHMSGSNPPPAGFFAAFERLLNQVHAVGGLVHLDTRNRRNVLVSEAGEPVLIDFQSQVGTRWMPAAMRRWIERFDMAGVYKHWARISPDTIDESRRDDLRRMNRWRRLWFLRGYLGARKTTSAK